MINHFHWQWKRWLEQWKHCKRGESQFYCCIDRIMRSSCFHLISVCFSWCLISFCSSSKTTAMVVNPACTLKVTRRSKLGGLGLFSGSGFIAREKPNPDRKLRFWRCGLPDIMLAGGLDTSRSCDLLYSGVGCQGNSISVHIGGGVIWLMGLL